MFKFKYWFSLFQFTWISSESNGKNTNALNQMVNFFTYILLRCYFIDFKVYTYNIFINRSR